MDLYLLYIYYCSNAEWFYRQDIRPKCSGLYKASNIQAPGNFPPALFDTRTFAGAQAVGRRHIVYRFVAVDTSVTCRDRSTCCASWKTSCKHECQDLFTFVRQTGKTCQIFIGELRDRSVVRARVSCVADGWIEHLVSRWQWYRPAFRGAVRIVFCPPSPFWRSPTGGAAVGPASHSRENAEVSSNQVDHLISLPRGQWVVLKLCNVYQHLYLGFKLIIWVPAIYIYILYYCFAYKIHVFPTH